MLFRSLDGAVRDVSRVTGTGSRGQWKGGGYGQAECGKEESGGAEEGNAVRTAGLWVRSARWPAKLWWRQVVHTAGGMCVGTGGIASIGLDVARVQLPWRCHKESLGEAIGEVRTKARSVR